MQSVKIKKKKANRNGWLFKLCRHRPIFPWRHHQSIFGTDELNCCVRDGNRCTLIAKDTDFATVISGYFIICKNNTFIRVAYDQLVTRTGFEPMLPA